MAHTFNMGFPWNVTSQIHSKIQTLRYTGQVIKLNHHHFIEESAICVNLSFHYVKLSERPLALSQNLIEILIGAQSPTRPRPP